MNANASKTVWVDPDDAPELTDEWFDGATHKVGEKVVRRGRPVGSSKPNTKRPISLRLDPDVIDGWRATGPGWQARMNAALREALRLPAN